MSIVMMFTHLRFVEASTGEAGAQGAESQLAGAPADEVLVAILWRLDTICNFLTIYTGLIAVVLSVYIATRLASWLDYVVIRVGAPKFGLLRRDRRSVDEPMKQGGPEVEEPVRLERD
jgi:hypothetical protein